MADIDKNVPVRIGERDGCDIHVVAVEEIAEALDKYYADKDPIAKCPFFNRPCLKEGCSAFEYRDHCLWNNPDDPRYRVFTKEKQPWLVDGKDEWFAVGIPFCRILDKELPMKVTEK